MNHSASEQFIEPYADLRAKDVSDLDLTNAGEQLKTSGFDTRTVWPAAEKLPPDFQPQDLLERGQLPALGVRVLHRSGITGAGVRVGIIDQPLNKDHEQYCHALARYLEIGTDCPEGNPSWWTPQMHGPAVMSLLAGRTCGSAPGASIHYYAHPMWVGYRYTNVALRTILQSNASAPPGNAVRLVSISTGHKRDDPLWDDWLVALQEAADAGVIVVHCSKHLGYVGCPLDADIDDPAAYRLASFYEGAGDTASDPSDKGRLFIPCDNRTFASPVGPNDYSFNGSGGGSWGVPYLAGVIALGLQLRPDLSEEECFTALRATGRPFLHGALLDPQAFIRRIQITRSPA